MEEEKGLKELKELLQIIDMKSENKELVNEINKDIKNGDYDIALEKIEKFFEENDDEKEKQ